MAACIGTSWIIKLYCYLPEKTAWRRGTFNVSEHVADVKPRPGCFHFHPAFLFLKFNVLRFVSDYLRFQLQRRPQHEKSRLRRRLHLLRADDDRTQVNVAAFCCSQLRPLFTRWRHRRGRVSLFDDRAAPDRESAGGAESWNSTEKLEGEKFKCKEKAEYSCFRFRLNRKDAESSWSPFAGNRLLEDWLLFCWKLEIYPGWMWLAWLIPTLKFIFCTTWANFPTPKDTTLEIISRFFS